MTGLRRRMTVGGVVPLVVVATALFGQVARIGDAGAAPVARAALAPGSINNVLVIELENEDADATFGPGSVATLSQRHTRPEGRIAPELLRHRSRQPGQLHCRDLRAGPDAPDRLGLQHHRVQQRHSWDRRPEHRDVSRAGRRQRLRLSGADGHDHRGADHRRSARRGLPAQPHDPRGLLAGVCRGHGQQSDAGRRSDRPTRWDRLRAPDGGRHGRRSHRQATDRYATRHNPFMYFHSIIDNAAECDANVVPLGTSAVGTASTFNGVAAAGYVHWPPGQ